MLEIFPFVDHLYWTHPVAVGIYIYVVLAIGLAVLLGFVTKKMKRVNRKLRTQRKLVYKQIAQQTALYAQIKGYLGIASDVLGVLTQIIQSMLWGYAETKILGFFRPQSQPRPLRWRLLSFGVVRTIVGRFR